jgi:hypothetical protein
MGSGADGIRGKWDQEHMGSGANGIRSTWDQGQMGSGADEIKRADGVIATMPQCRNSAMPYIHNSAVSAMHSKDTTGCCLLSAVCCLLSTIYCLLSTGYWLLATGYWHRARSKWERPDLSRPGTLLIQRWLLACMDSAWCVVRGLGCVVRECVRACVRERVSA